MEEKYKVKGNVVAWLNGKQGMAIEWYNKGLRYKNHDNTLIYPQEKPYHNIIIYNDKEYYSQSELSNELGVSSASICNWLKGKTKIPQNIAENGLRYKELPNNNL